MRSPSPPQTTDPTSPISTASNTSSYSEEAYTAYDYHSAEIASVFFFRYQAEALVDHCSNIDITAKQLLDSIATMNPTDDHQVGLTTLEKPESDNHSTAERRIVVQRHTALTTMLDSLVHQVWFPAFTQHPSPFAKLRMAKGMLDMQLAWLSDVHGAVYQDGSGGLAKLTGGYEGLRELLGGIVEEIYIVLADEEKWEMPSEEQLEDGFPHA